MCAGMCTTSGLAWDERAEPVGGRDGPFGAGRRLDRMDVQVIRAPGAWGSSLRRSRVVTISSVPGWGEPSFIHRSQGRRSIIDSANSVPTSSSAG